MTGIRRTALAATMVALSAAACQVAPNRAAADDAEPTWIGETGEPSEQVVARHFRGLDVAMIEMDHRFAELYFAGLDGNWPYADHQVEHMREAMELALERRPARARSTHGNFYPALEPVEAAIEAEDQDAFLRSFEGLRRACNTCHQAEDEPTFTVGTPTQRRTTIGAG